MIIDDLPIYIEIIAETKPYFTHIGAEEVVTKMKEEMDKYASRYGLLAEKVWKEEYLKQPNVMISCASSSVGVSLSMKSSS